MKKNYFITTLLLTMLIINLINCKHSIQTTKDSSLAIPPYAKTMNYDWSMLPKGQKIDYYKNQIGYIDKLLSLQVVTENEVQIPSRQITRKEFIHWLIKLMDFKLQSNGYSFADVPKSLPEHDFIITAVLKGIIEKTDTFRPDDPLIRSEAALWLVNARGNQAKAEALKYKEPLIPAQDGYFEVPENAIGTMTVCILPEYQLLQYRWTEGDEFRYIRPNDPMLVVEAAYSIFMVRYPPKQGGALVIGQTQEPTSLFSGVDSSSASGEITSLLYESAVGGYDEFWCNFPVMVKRIPTQENGLWKIKKSKESNGTEKITMTVTFELRKGLFWADGSPITGDDAVFSYLLTNHPSFPGIHNESDYWVDRIVVDPQDPYRITVYWNTSYLFANENISFMPRNYFEKKLQYALKSYDIKDKSYYDSNRDDPETEDKDESFKSAQYLKDEEFVQKVVASDYNQKPMHNGSYTVANWQQGQSIVLKANPYYLFGKPLLDSITFRLIDNTDTLLAAAKAGNVDMTLVGLSFEQAEELKNQSKTNLKVVFTPSLTWEHIDLNIDNPVLADSRVRKALLYGLDRESIVKEFFKGVQPVADGWFPPKHPAFDETNIQIYPYDKVKAEALLEEAGWKLNQKTKKRMKDGKEFSITLITTAGNKTREQVQAVIASAWKEMGLNVITKNETASSLFATTLPERKFSGPTAVLFAWNMGPSSNLFSMCYSKNIPSSTNERDGQNYTGYRNAEVDQILTSNEKQLSKVEINKGLKRIQQLLVNDLPSLPLFYRISVTTCPKNLINYLPTGTNTHETWNTPWWYWSR